MYHQTLALVAPAHKAPKPLSEIPLTPSVTTPSVQPIKTSSAATSTTIGSTYAVVVATVTTESVAQQWLERLQKQGIDARVIPSAANPTNTYTIQLNQEWIREIDALKMADKIGQSYAITPQVVIQQLHY